MTDPALTQDEQPWVQVLRSERGTLHLGVNDTRACELRGEGAIDPTPNVGELADGVPPDTPTDRLCAVCFELGRGG